MVLLILTDRSFVPTDKLLLRRQVKVKRNRYSLPQMGSVVHGQASSATTESVSLRSVLAAVAVLAEQHRLVLTAVCGIQSLVAHA